MRPIAIQRHSGCKKSSLEKYSSQISSINRRIKNGKGSDREKRKMYNLLIQQLEDEVGENLGLLPWSQYPKEKPYPSRDNGSLEKKLRKIKEFKRFQ